MNAEENLKHFLEELEEQESGKIHRNSTEKDVTTGLGIYLHGREDTRVYKVVSNLGSQIGLNPVTSTWSNMDCERLELHLSHNANDKQELYDASFEFYMDYFKRLGIDGLHPRIALNIMSLYVNSRKLAVTTLQKSFNLVVKYVPAMSSIKLDEDGLIGPATRNNVKMLSQMLTDTQGNAWNGVICAVAHREYYKLVEKDSSKSIYIKGWFNRVKENMLDGFKYTML